MQATASGVDSIETNKVDEEDAYGYDQVEAESLPVDIWKRRRREPLGRDGQPSSASSVMQFNAPRANLGTGENLGSRAQETPQERLTLR